MQQSVRGGVVDAPDSSGMIWRERLNTQMWSSLSTVRVGTCCMIHLCGNGLGQKGSTLYMGLSCARAARAATAAQTKHRMIVAAGRLGHFFHMFTECFPLAYLVEPCRSVRRSLVSACADINGVIYGGPASQASRGSK